jgi:hypothetical protein
MGYTPAQLQLPYLAWKVVEGTITDAHERAWLAAWKRWDLACSPMPDSERRLLRYGHWLGWHARRQQHAADQSEWSYDRGMASPRESLNA